MNTEPTSPKKFVLIFLGVLVAAVLAVAMAMKSMHQRPQFNPPAAPPPPAPSAKAAPTTDFDTNGMVWVPGGSFYMGSEDADSRRDEQPVHLVTVDGFWMDKYEVTNEEFEKFAKASGYLTIAERKPDPKDFPGVPPENLQAGSVVFEPPPGEVPLNNHWVWWKYVPGANWRHPEGPQSDIKGREKHPAVHICWDDAAAYCRWASKRLPTEAEWEYAARGGLDRKVYPWGNERNPGGKWLMNTWQGKFPHENTKEDNFAVTAPAGSYPPNGFGLYDMAGNVFEWCADWYTPDYYSRSPEKNPPGPDTSNDPNEPNVAKRVHRGGSWLCSELYSTNYRVAAREKASTDTGLSHTGFRCVRSVKK